MPCVLLAPQVSKILSLDYAEIHIVQRTLYFFRFVSFIRNAIRYIVIDRAAWSVGRSVGLSQS